MEFFTLYLRQETFILIPVLYIIGVILGQTPKIPVWTHSWIKVLFSIIACLLYFGLDITSVVQGILVTGAEMILRDLFEHPLVAFQEKRTANRKTNQKRDTKK